MARPTADPPEIARGRGFGAVDHRALPIRDRHLSDIYCAPQEPTQGGAEVTLVDEAGLVANESVGRKTEGVGGFLGEAEPTPARPDGCGLNTSVVRFPIGNQADAIVRRVTHEDQVGSIPPVCGPSDVINANLELSDSHDLGQ